MKIYLETTVPNFLFIDKDIEERKITENFFAIELKKHFGYISNLLIKEIDKAPEDLKRKLHEVIKKHDFKLLKVTDEAEKLADEYMKEGIIPERYRDDALHIAIAVVNNMDVIVSWNMKHIVKLKTIITVNKVNQRLGYKSIFINTPEEVIE